MATEDWLASNGAELGLEAGGVRCTDAAGVWLSRFRTREFLCTAHRSAGGCALLRVRIPERGGPLRVTVAEPRADCVQPF